jgi:hypothetical protein
MMTVGLVEIFGKSVYYKEDGRQAVLQLAYDVCSNWTSGLRGLMPELCVWDFDEIQSLEI